MSSYRHGGLPQLEVSVGQRRLVGTTQGRVSEVTGGGVLIVLDVVLVVCVCVDVFGGGGGGGGSDYEMCDIKGIPKLKTNFEPLKRRNILGYIAFLKIILNFP